MQQRKLGIPGRAGAWALFAAILPLATLMAGEMPAAAGFAKPKPPKVPTNLQVPDGNTVYLKTHAIGTQNYVCVPGTSGPFWKFLGPQATLFVTTPWMGREVRWQIATHYLSANPSETGTPRPAWQSSLDSSTVWGRAIANSTDPYYVAEGAIPWLLVQTAGTQEGPTGGSTFSITTFIHRVNTSGGTAPTEGCDENAYGNVALVPYSTDYYFYRAIPRR